MDSYNYKHYASILRTFNNLTIEMKTFKQLVPKPEDRELLRQILMEWSASPKDPSLTPLIKGLAEFLQTED